MSLNITLIIEAQKILNQAVSSVVEDLELFQPFAQATLRLKALEKYELPPTSKEASYIYVFSVGQIKESVLLRDLCSEEKIMKRINLPRINKCNPGRVLYVGSSTTGIQRRINEHLGFGHNATYSLQLNKWANKLPFSISFIIYEIKEVGQDIIQLLEDSLSNKHKPVLGKKGGR